jgi:hypothetical protein
LKNRLSYSFKFKFKFKIHDIQFWHECPKQVEIFAINNWTG